MAMMMARGAWLPFSPRSCPAPVGQRVLLVCAWLLQLGLLQVRQVDCRACRWVSSVHHAVHVSSQLYTQLCAPTPTTPYPHCTQLSNVLTADCRCCCRTAATTAAARQQGGM